MKQLGGKIVAVKGNVKAAEKKKAKGENQNEAMINYVQKVCAERPQIRMIEGLESNFYRQRILVQENPEIINQLLSSKKPMVKSVFHTPCFPHLEVNLKGSASTLKLPSCFTLTPSLL